jgi:hypothetical protein
LVKNYSGRFLKIQEDSLKFRRIPLNSGKFLKKLRNFPEFVRQFHILKIPYASLINSDAANSSNFIRMASELFFAVKVPEIDRRGSFERFLSVCRPYKYKKGSKDTILYQFTPFPVSPWPKNGSTPTLSPRISRKSLPFRPL